MKDSPQALTDLERDLDLPLGWELTRSAAEMLRRRLVAERNQAGQAAMMRMMRPARG